MSCEQFLESVDALALGALSEPEAWAMRAHIASCDGCAREFALARATVERLPLSVAQVRAPSALRDSVIAAIHAGHTTRAALAADGDGSAPAQPAGDLATSLPAGEPAKLPIGVRGRRVVWIGAVAAALLVTVLAAWGVRSQLRLNDAQRDRDQVRAELAALKRSPSTPSVADEELTALLTAPNTVTAGLYPQAWSHAAGAIVWNPDQQRCYVLVRQLTRPNAGMEYHVWFVSGEKRWDGGVLTPEVDGTAETSIYMGRWAVDGGYVISVVLQPVPDDGTRKSVLTGSVSAYVP